MNILKNFRVINLSYFYIHIYIYTIYSLIIILFCSNSVLFCRYSKYLAYIILKHLLVFITTDPREIKWNDRRKNSNMIFWCYCNITEYIYTHQHVNELKLKIPYNNSNIKTYKHATDKKGKSGTYTHFQKEKRTP